MRTDEDYLRELELWPIFALQKRVTNSASAALPAAIAKDDVPAVSPRPVVREAVREAGREAPVVPVARPARPMPAPAVAPVTTTAPIDPARAARIATLDWDALASEVAACNACGLCKQRKQAVFGVGARSAPWLLVGEGPGAEEDQQGEPFVGQAGKLLDAMLAAMKLQRGREVYIANVVKCRPPGNRTPSTDEALACAPFLDRQIALIQPKLIVALGKTAVTRLTGSEASMASLRGTLHEYHGIPVVATYHPAYLLRNLPEKLKAWEDFNFARRTMESLGQS
jgi:uracil-DNA glycosylase